MTWNFVKDETQDAALRRTLVEVLYRKYSQALRKFLARARLQPDEVADIVQETYCRIHESGQAHAIRDPKSFLFRVANNVRLNAAKRRRRGIEIEIPDVESLQVDAGEPSAYRSCKGEQELAIVRAALEELAPKCREAFVLNRFENRTFVQIAAELGLSVSMIEKHISHAISHLKKSLERERPASRVRTLRLRK